MRDVTGQAPLGGARGRAIGRLCVTSFEPARLQAIYEEQLRDAAAGGGDARHDRRVFRAMLRAVGQLPPQRLAVPDDAGVWFWSDLHLGHENIIRYANRPFANAAEMDERLHANWRETVSANDTLVVVGDVAMRDALGEHTWRRIRQARGKRKLLVMGNHDITGRGDLRTGGFDEICAALCVDGTPPLLCTHLPLQAVPAGCVNVHGHTHDEAPRQSAHINVSVEQLNYRPVPLAHMRALARELVAGRYPAGATTLARIAAVVGAGA